MPTTSDTSRPRPPTRRGAVSKTRSVLVGAWIPDPIVAQLDAAVRAHDTDRSKVMRAALRDYLDRLNSRRPSS